MEQHLKHPVFKVIGQAAQNLNVQCYAIGGFVRDIFLKRDSKDVDVVAIGSGIDLANAVAKLLPNKPQVSVLKALGQPC